MKKLLLLILIVTISVAAANAQQKASATVNQANGLYMFVDSKPNAEFTFLGQVDAKKFRNKANPQYQLIRDFLLKKAKETYPDADGIIFHFAAGDLDKADVIKFK